MKSNLQFPRRSGHDVHCYSMMRELASLGHSISLISDAPVSDQAIAGVECIHRQTFDEYGPVDGVVTLSKLQQRFRSYWGVPGRNIAVLADASRRWEADVVVVVGLDVLPYLSGVESAIRVWYAADEWFLHHMSQVFPTKPATWGEGKAALVKGLYERVYASCVDRVWVVSDRDARAVRWVMGTAVDVAPNGVDFDHYRRVENVAIDQQPKSCVFWGRLDFGPNIDAIEWFCEHVWRDVAAQTPGAVFNVFGFAPSEKVRALADQYGFILTPDLPDIRAEITKNQVVVLPFVSGAGIKNKLLEAAALSMPIVASPRVVDGLRLGDHNPLIVAKRTSQWGETLRSLWSEDASRQQLGQRAREWVASEYSWRQAAEKVLRPLQGEVKSR
ncbi:glycosyltransferase family 4 protein [Novipirellula aureliae]|nr:glycosyltransferase family 4 protein [Novipirellula aureliae]